MAYTEANCPTFSAPEMPVPWEALIPFGLLTAMFGATGTLLSLSKRAANDGKPPRWGLDVWEDMMMERDRRLTGTRRGQWVEPLAPPEFATNRRVSTS